jgi:selenocysteine lyase/cysteine desulfurase
MSAPATAAIANPLARWRSEFPIFDRAIYLNSCSLGALSRSARGRVDGSLDQWDARGAANWYDVWWASLDELRNRYSTLVNARPGEIALHPSVSSILGVLGSGIDTTRRRRVVTTNLDFPTVPYQWLSRDVDLVMLESPDGVTVPVEMFEHAIDGNTALVVTSHVYYTSGAIQDIRAVAAAARRAGALSLIDGYQGAGQLPVDVRELGVDFYVSGGLKWLLGGTGITFLYARAETTAGVVPIATGWFAHREQFAFDPAHFAPHADARRFETGTPALLSVHSQLGGLDVLEGAGIPAIRAATAALTEDLRSEAMARGLSVRSAARASERSAIVMIPRSDPRADVARLAAAGIIVDSRPGHVRVSPYFYNVADDHRALLEVLLDG